MLENKLNKLDNLFREEELSQVQETESNSIEETNTNVKKTRKCPNEPAKVYEIGFTKVSENDGKTYKVVEVSGLKRTMKRWVIVK